MIQLLFRFDAVFLKLLDHPTAWWHDVVNQLNPVKILIWVGVGDTKEVGRGYGYVIRMKTDEWKTIVY